MAIEFHDPVQIINQLRQILAADKLAVGFFLGAGCACAVRVPGTDGQPAVSLIQDIAGLTKEISTQLIANAELKSAFEQLLLTFKEDEVTSPTIETMLNRLRTFKDVAGKVGVRNLQSESLDKLDKEICRAVRSAVNKELPDHETPYHALARFISFRKYPHTEIFTTNYDLLIERALEKHRVPFFDGFIGSSRPFFDLKAIEENEIPLRWSRLWKIHGSINWRYKSQEKHIIRTEAEDGDELLIHPSHLKYDESRRMPYYVMIDRFRNFIRGKNRPVALIMSGYSFGDDHINGALVECLDSNPSAACFAFQYGCMTKYPGAAKLAKETPNLSLFTYDRAVIRKQDAPWMIRPSSNLGALEGSFELPPHEDGADAEIPKVCKLKLGDFNHLGAFLNKFIEATSRQAAAE